MTRQLHHSRREFSPSTISAVAKKTVLLALLFSLSHGGKSHAAPNEAQHVSEQLEGIQIALEQWQLEDARRLAEDLHLKLPDIPPVQAAVASVKFHQGDYLSAKNLFDRAAEAVTDPYLHDLAISTYQETQGFVAKESEHFVVRTPKGKDEILADIALWALEKAYARITAAFDYAPTYKIPVDILHDARGLANVSPLTVDEIETSGTIALCKYNRLMVTSPKALARGYSWLDTLAHEFVHLVISEKSKNTVPIWLHEGLAKYSESLWIEGPGTSLDPYAENLLSEALQNDALITFEQMHPSMAKLPSQSDTALAFAEVFTVIEFLHKRESKKRKAGLDQQGISDFSVTNRLLEQLAAGQSMDDALQESAGMDLNRLQVEWKRYLKKRTFKRSAHTTIKTKKFVRNARQRVRSADEDNDEATLAEVGNKKGKKFARLGNLLRRRGHLGAANIEYEKALQHLSRPSPILRNRMASIYLELQEREKARAILKQSMKDAPRDPQTQILMGRLAFLEKDYEASAQHYQKATWENPFNPEIHNALYRIGEAQKDEDMKATAFRSIQLLREHSTQQKTKTGIQNASTDGAFGTISIHSNPWGSVVINGHGTEISTPLLDYPLAPGSYRIRVRDPVTGHQATQEIELKAGESRRLQLDLKAIDAATRERWLEEESRFQANRIQRTNTNENSDAGPSSRQ